MRLIKDGDHIQLQANGKVSIDWTDNDAARFGPPHGGGKIGFRQMSETVGEYRNLSVGAGRCRWLIPRLNAALALATTGFLGVWYKITLCALSQLTSLGATHCRHCCRGAMDSGSQESNKMMSQPPVEDASSQDIDKEVEAALGGASIEDLMAQSVSKGAPAGPTLGSFAPGARRAAGAKTAMASRPTTSNAAPWFPFVKATCLLIWAARARACARWNSLTKSLIPMPAANAVRSKSATTMNCI